MRIGLTGGIGCGVTEVARRLQAKGLVVVSGDECGHLALKEFYVQLDLLRRFGSEIFESQGVIDRRKLAQIAFSDNQANEDLNNIVHPELLSIFTDQIRKAEEQKGIVVADAALIYEWGFGGVFHKIIVVTAPLKLRIERVMQRSKLKREQVLQRMAAQLPLNWKVEQADYVIKNNSTLDELYRQVDAVWEDIEKVRRSSKKRSLQQEISFRNKPRSRKIK